MYQEGCGTNTPLGSLCAAEGEKGNAAPLYGGCCYDNGDCNTRSLGVNNFENEGIVIDTYANQIAGAPDPDSFITTYTSDGCLVSDTGVSSFVYVPGHNEILIRVQDPLNWYVVRKANAKERRDQIANKMAKEKRATRERKFIA